MLSRRVFQLSRGDALLELETRYLRVTERGTLCSPAEVERYTAVLEAFGREQHRRRLLLDARQETPAEAPESAAAMWRWLRTQTAFDAIAFVLESQNTCTRVNMTALSERLPLRAFEQLAPALRWLTQGATSSSTRLRAQRGREPDDEE